MSKEMLPRELSAQKDFGREPPIVIETKEGKGKGPSVFLLLAVGVGILALAAISLLPYLNPFGGNIIGSISSSSISGNSGENVVKETAALSASFKAIDGKGNVIENSNNGISRSEQITISGYSDSEYSTKLRCSIDSLPAYCDGSPVTISGLPPGLHTFTVEEPSGGETIVRAFNWHIVYQ
jgi:hypothetical protein